MHRYSEKDVSRQLNKVIDMDLWITIKNEYEIKLNRLNADLQRHQNANIDYMDTGLKILDVCHKASLPYTELKPETIAQFVWQSYSSVTVKEKSVKMKFAEPFATLEKLVRVAKQGIAELGYDEFAKV
ncbi:unknown [Fusobacterium sp. CAG:439]|nr:unknown [Fusobacterium sp. CAG:439]